MHTNTHCLSHTHKHTHTHTQICEARQCTFNSQWEHYQAVICLSATIIFRARPTQFHLPPSIFVFFFLLHSLPYFPSLSFHFAFFSFSLFLLLGYGAFYRTLLF